MTNFLRIGVLILLTLMTVWCVGLIALGEYPFALVIGLILFVAAVAWLYTFPPLIPNEEQLKLLTSETRLARTSRSWRICGMRARLNLRLTRPLWARRDRLR